MKIIKLKDEKDIITKNLKIFLYGGAFVGKTTFATTFPRPIIISTDGNIGNLANVNEDALAVILSDYEEVATTSGVMVKESGWTSFSKLVNGLVDNDGIDTIVVDLIKDVYDMMRKKILDGLGFKHESEVKVQGKIWTMYDSEFLPVLRKLMTSNKNVILISHEKTRDGLTGPSTIGSLTQKIQGYVDINCRLMIAGVPGQSEERRLFTGPAIGQEGGNRLNIKTKSINSPTYEKLIKAIKGEI